MKLAVLDHDPYILVITETWLHADVSDAEITPPGYTVIRKDRGRRGGGVTVMIKSNISFTILPVESTIESVLIKTKLSSHTVFIGGVYRPPGCSI